LVGLYSGLAVSTIEKKINFTYIRNQIEKLTLRTTHVNLKFENLIYFG